MQIIALLLVLAADEPTPAPAAPTPGPHVVAPVKPIPPATTPDGARTCRIAVPNLVARGLSAADAAFPALLSEVMANEVASASKCQVLSQSDIQSMVDFEATRANCDAGSDNCMAELGTALGVDRIVAGSIGQLGADYLITVRLVNIGAAEVEQRAEEVVSGQPEKLRLAAKLVARALFPHTKPAIEPTPAPAGPPLMTPLFLGGVGAGVVGVVGVVVGGAIGADAGAKLGDPANTAKDDALGAARGAFWLTTVALVVAGAGAGLGTFAALSPEL